MALATTWPKLDVLAHWPHGGWWDPQHRWWDDFAEDGRFENVLIVGHQLVKELVIEVETADRAMRDGTLQIRQPDGWGIGPRRAENRGHAVVGSSKSDHPWPQGFVDSSVRAIAAPARRRTAEGIS